MKEVFWSSELGRMVIVEDGVMNDVGFGTSSRGHVAFSDVVTRSGMKSFYVDDLDGEDMQRLAKEKALSNWSRFCQPKPDAPRGSGPSRLAAAIIENAHDFYDQDKEDIEAWLAGAAASLSFADACDWLGIVDTRACMSYIRGQ